MLRRINATSLILASIVATILSPLLTGLLPSALFSLAAPVARAATSTTLTLAPALAEPLGSDAPPRLLELQLPAVLDVDLPQTFVATWAGDGAALDTGWEVVFQLRGADGAVVAELISERDLAASLSAGEPALAEDFWVSPGVAPGAYTLSLLVRDPRGERGPLALGIAGAQADGSYALGSVEVAPAAAPAVEAAAEPAPAPEIATSAAFSVYLPLLMRSAAPADPGLDTSVGTSRGYLTTPQELRAIKAKADQGKEPYASNVRELFNNSSLTSSTAWISQSSISGNVLCSDGSQKDANGNTMPKGPNYLIEGSRLTYAKALVAVLKGGTSGEAYARNARSRILDLTDTTKWGGSVHSYDNQCILYLGWYIPSFIMAADLLEAFPTIWTSSDKRSFQRWLDEQVYSRVAWASRARVNNWGAGGSYASAAIADYLHDSGFTLQEVAPTARSLTPGQAYAEHTSEQLKRMSTVISPRDESSSRCLPLKGIQPSGGIPDELRRATISNALGMCTAKYLVSITGDYAPAYNYQQVHSELLLGHAELALRRGDRRLYNNIAGDNSGSILRAIKFIIANPTKSYDWDPNRKAMLYIAYRYYRDGSIKARLHSSALRSGHAVSYGELTHGFADGETISGPPTVAPPSP